MDAPLEPHAQSPAMPRLVVKHHRPFHTGLAIAGGTAAILFALWGAFAYGEYRAGFDRQAAGALQDALDEAQERDAALNEQITVLQRQRQVDQSAGQQVQASLDELQRRLADVQEEVAFYKGIVSPGAGEEGLRVQSLKFTNGGAPRLYHYRLVLIQVRTRELKVSGNVSMKIYGVQDGKAVTLDARDVAPNGRAPSGFGFQYFQSLEGDAFLPPGFTPGRVEVTVQESGHEPVLQNFDWSTLGA
ncbi:MAG TPA: DUF6776 family protein [Gammaproteobacteria bacterium]|nr:DUF6776 family protein [Gammaproteobacteria bacterium]